MVMRHQFKFPSPHSPAVPAPMCVSLSRVLIKRPVKLCPYKYHRAKPSRPGALRLGHSAIWRATQRGPRSGLQLLSYTPNGHHIEVGGAQAHPPSNFMAKHVYIARRGLCITYGATGDLKCAAGHYSAL